MKRLPEHDGVLLFAFDIPLGTTEEEFSKTLRAAGVPISADRVSIKPQPKKGVASALVSIPKEFIADLINARIASRRQSLRLIPFGYSSPRKTEQDLPPLTPDFMTRQAR